MLEKTLESPLDRKEIKPVHPKGNQPWRFIGRTDAEAETPILWPPDVKNWLIRKDPDSGKLKAGGEGDDRGRDGWMASLPQWTRVWVNSASWWWTGRPGVLQSMGSQRVGQDWVTELNGTVLMQGWGMVVRGANQVVRELEFSIPALWPPGRGEELEVQFNHQWIMI